MHYKKILIATDLSENTQPIMQKALALAKTFGAEVSLLHIIEPVPAFGYPELMDFEGTVIEESRKQLNALGSENGIDAARCHVEMGSVRLQVLNTAREQGTDLIIVGSHGKHGWAPILGSSATAIVNGAECDVLTIRHEESA